MSAALVADTDLVIDFLRGRGEGASLLPVWLRAGRLRLTAVTMYELRCGYDWGRRAQGIEALFVGGALPLDRAAALQAGIVEAELRATGDPIGVADTLQAGICRAQDLALATRNAEHFRRVPSLTLVDLAAERAGGGAAPGS